MDSPDARSARRRKVLPSSRNTVPSASDTAISTSSVLTSSGIVYPPSGDIVGVSMSFDNDDFRILDDIDLGDLPLSVDASRQEELEGGDEEPLDQFADFPRVEGFYRQDAGVVSFHGEEAQVGQARAGEAQAAEAQGGRAQGEEA